MTTPRKPRAPKEKPDVVPQDVPVEQNPAPPVTTGEAKPAKRIPDCPPMDPAFGDKTLEVVQWWYKYHPEEAERRYGHRRLHGKPGSQEVAS